MPLMKSRPKLREVSTSNTTFGALAQVRETKWQFRSKAKAKT